MDRVPLIAIVDDDDACRLALAELMEVFQFMCRTFDSGESFVAAHAPGHFDCLMTDLNLPGESGFHLQHRLKTLEPSLPVIFISAQADPTSRTLAMTAGAVAYLTKPVADQVLLQHLMVALGRDTSPL